MKRGFYVLLGILVLLIIIALIIERPFKGGEKEELLFPGFDRSMVEKVEIKESGETVKLKREEDRWVVSTAKGYPADEEAVEEMFDEMEEMTSRELISENPDKYSKFKVNEEGIEVKMFGKGDKILAHFFVGKLGPDYISTYVRKADSKQVYLIPRTLRPVFGKGKTGWCDKEVISFDPQLVSSLEFEESGAVLLLKRSEKGWRMVKPEEAKADTKVVEDILKKLSNFKADDVEVDKNEVECGLDAPSAKIVIRFKDGSEQMLSFGKEQNNKRYLKTKGKDQIFKLYKYRVSEIFKKPDDLKIKEEGKNDEKGKEGD